MKEVEVGGVFIFVGFPPIRASSPSTSTMTVVAI